MKAYFISFILVFISSISLSAMDVNIDVDIKTSTKYSQCYYIADKIVELASVFAYTTRNDREEIARKIHNKKKKLKRCEKKAKKWV